jgi:hypothetical protein
MARSAATSSTTKGVQCEGAFKMLELTIDRRICCGIGGEIMMLVRPCVPVTHPKLVNWAATNMTRALAAMMFVCAALCEAGIAQTKPAPASTLYDALVWMNHFSRDHGFFTDDHGSRISNQFLSRGCNASIEVIFPATRTSKTNIRKRTVDLDLGQLNPKVTLQATENEREVEVYFEPADPKMKIHETIEYGDGAKLEAWVTSETMYFDVRGSAIRFARAFSQVITLCGKASPA